MGEMDGSCLKQMSHNKKMQRLAGDGFFLLLLAPRHATADFHGWRHMPGMPALGEHSVDTIIGDTSMKNLLDGIDLKSIEDTSVSSKKNSLTRM